MDISNFWKRVNVLIATHNTNEEEFAVTIGVPKSIFRSWILYNRIPDMMSICTIAATFGVTMDFLILGKETREALGNYAHSSVHKAVERIESETEFERSYYEQPIV